MNRATLSVSLVLATLPFASFAFAESAQNDDGRGMDAPDDIESPWFLGPGSHFGTIDPEANDSYDWYQVEAPPLGFLRTVTASGGVSVDCMMDVSSNNTTHREPWPCGWNPKTLNPGDDDFGFGIRATYGNRTNYSVWVFDRANATAQDDDGRGMDAPDRASDAWELADGWSSGRLEAGDPADWYSVTLTPTQPRAYISVYAYGFDIHVRMPNNGSSWVFHDYLDLRITPADGPFLFGITPAGGNESYFFSVHRERPADISVDNLTLRQVRMGPTQSPFYRALTVDLSNLGPNDANTTLQLRAFGTDGRSFCAILTDTVMLRVGETVTKHYDVDTTGWVGSVIVQASVDPTEPDPNEANNQAQAQVDIGAPVPGHCTRVG